MDFKNLKYVVETKGQCLENLYPNEFFLCRDCFCKEICGFQRLNKTSKKIEKSKREKRFQLAKHTLRLEKMKRILE